MSISRSFRRALALCALPVLATVAGAQHATSYQWSPARAVTADLDRSGVVDSARLGVGAKSAGLLIHLDDKALPIIDIPMDANRQFGICPDLEPTIRIVPQSEAPLHALGEMPRGYAVCAKCVEIEVAGRDCDAIHFYWDPTTGALAWWRA